MTKDFSDLTEQEILALAISLEEEDERIYDNFVQGLKDEYPASARMFRKMAAEETEHRQRLMTLYRERFGDHIPLIRRRFMETPIWSAAFQVVFGGALVFATGIVIGSS